MERSQENPVSLAIRAGEVPDGLAEEAAVVLGVLCVSAGPLASVLQWAKEQMRKNPTGWLSQDPRAFPVERHRDLLRLLALPLRDLGIDGVPEIPRTGGPEWPDQFRSICDDMRARMDRAADKLAALSMDKVAEAGVSASLATRARGAVPDAQEPPEEPTLNRTPLERLWIVAGGYMISVVNDGPFRTKADLIREAGFRRRQSAYEVDGWESVFKLVEEAEARAKRKRGICRPRGKRAPRSGEWVSDPTDRGQADSSHGAPLSHVKMGKREKEDDAAYQERMLATFKPLIRSR